MRQRLVPSALAVLGLGLAATGVAAVFMAESDTGAAALLTIGVILVLFAAVGDRLESLRYGDFELVLRRKADEAARRGDIVEAKALQRAADTVAQRVARLARSYTTARGSCLLDSSGQRRWTASSMKPRRTLIGPTSTRRRSLAFSGPVRRELACGPSAF